MKSPILSIIPQRSSLNLFFLLLVLLFFLPNQVSHAKLGESPQQIEKRFGVCIEGVKPLEPATKAGSYLKDSWSIKVGFFNEKACYEIFTKTDASGLKIDEIKEFLKESIGHSEWKETKSMSTQQRQWASLDLKAGAVYDMVEHRLFIMTKEFMKNSISWADENEDPEKFEPFKAIPKAK